MKCLTEYQIPNLNTSFNLSDAHARQSYSNGLTEVVSNFSKIFADSEVSNYEKLLKNCLDTFMVCSNQLEYKKFEFIASHTASQSMEVVANYLRLNNMNVFLIEPTFDNIPDILKRHNINVSAVSEKSIIDLSIPSEGVNSIFLTLPNNPTGFILSEAEFERIVKHCSDNSITLIIDACFRLFDERMMFDWYKILAKFKLKFIAIEDTGKIWPTQDLKVSFIISDVETIVPLTRISRDFLLNISPFILLLLINVINFSKENDLKDFRNLLEENRQYLREAAKRYNLFEVLNPESQVSVVLLKINFNENSKNLVDFLYSHGLGVLPGVPFFWNSKETGEKYIRVALARDKEYFTASIDKLFNSTNQFVNG